MNQGIAQISTINVELTALMNCNSRLILSNKEIFFEFTLTFGLPVLQL